MSIRNKRKGGIKEDQEEEKRKKKEKRKDISMEIQSNIGNMPSGIFPQEKIGNAYSRVRKKEEERKKGGKRESGEREQKEKREGKGNEGEGEKKERKIDILHCNKQLQKERFV